MASKDVAIHHPPDLVEVLLALFHRLTSDNQSIARLRSHNPLHRGYQVLDTLIRTDGAEKQNRFVTLPYSKPLFGFSRSEACGRRRVVDPKRDDGDRSLTYSKILEQLRLHLLRMNENTVRKS